MFENLTEKLERSFKILKGEGKITEINVAETLKEVRKALLDADVNYKVAKSFTDEVKRKALGMNVLNAIRPGQLMVKVVHDELAELMGGKAANINLLPSWQATSKPKRENRRCWLPVTFTDRQPLSSLRCLATRLASQFSPFQVAVIPLT